MHGTWESPPCIRRLDTSGLFPFAATWTSATSSRPRSSLGAAEGSARAAPFTLPGRAVIAAQGVPGPCGGGQDTRASPGARAQTSVTLSPRPPVMSAQDVSGTGLSPNHTVPHRRPEPAHTCKENPQKLNNESTSLKIPIVALLAKRRSLTCLWLQTSGAEMHLTGEPAPASHCGGKEARAWHCPFGSQSTATRRWSSLTPWTTRVALGDVTVCSDRDHAFSLETWRCRRFRQAPSSTTWKEGPATRQSWRLPGSHTLSLQCLVTGHQDALSRPGGGSTSQTEHRAASTMSV